MTELTKEQIAQGWHLHDGSDTLPITAGTLVQYEDEEFGVNHIGIALYMPDMGDDWTVVKSYRTFSPDLPSPPVSGEVVGYMLIYPGCECGPTETCESVAYQKLAESPPGTELRPVYFHPSPLTNEPVGVTLSRDEIALIMTEEWNEICNDTSCHPLDITHGNGSKLFFKPSHWVDQIADRLSAAIGERG